MKIRHNGYYLSEAQPYEDWHGGVKIEHINYIAYYFMQDGRMYIAGKTNENLFKKEDFPDEKKPVYYVESENSFELIRNKYSHFEVRSKFSKTSSDEFFNSSQIKFKFNPWKSDIIENS